MRANVGMNRLLIEDCASLPVRREIDLRELSSVMDRISHLFM